MAKPESQALTLLDAVHQAILSADFAALPALSAALEQELAQPGTIGGAADLQALHAKAQRNAVCLKAAQRGIKAARRRLSDIRSAASGLVTYDGQGRRSQVGGSRSLTQRL